MKQSELLKRLRDAGCILSRHGSKHDKWINPKTGAYDYVPRHCKEVAKGTAMKVLIDWQGNNPLPIYEPCVDLFVELFSLNDKGLWRKEKF